MSWIVVQLLGSALMLAAGIQALRRSRRLATALVAGMLLLLVLKPVVVHLPAAEPRLFPWDWYPEVEHWWYFFPAMFILGAGLGLVRESVWKRDLLLVVAGYLPIHGAIVAGLGTLSHEELRGVAGPDGICLQTSGYSCAAASSVMLLHCYGIEATEREMADLCRTRPGSTTLSGTSDSGMMRGLRHKLQGRAVPEIVAPDVSRIPVPSLVAIRVNARVGHCLVVTGVGPDQVSVLDPLYGRGVLSRRQFERDWLGSAIAVKQEAR